MIEVRSPHDGRIVGRVPCTDHCGIDGVLVEAERGARIARSIPRSERADALVSAARAIESRIEGFARTITLETGKALRQARKEVTRCVHTLLLSAEEAKRCTGAEIPFDAFGASRDRQGFYSLEPLGIILAITAYNDPLNLAAHKIGPALAGGNAVILKPSERAPLSAGALAEELWSAGVPKSVLQVVHGGAALVQSLVRDARPRMVSFTGGTEAGKAIVAAAGVKKIAMELGGTATVIVMEDCDLDLAVESCVAGAFSAAGQNCIGTQRIVVQEPLYDEFIGRLAARTQQLRVGDPLDEATDVGPMIGVEQAQALELLVDAALENGAKALCGHRREGAFFFPTVLIDVSRTDRVWTDEVFGPAVSVAPFRDLGQAIDMVNEAQSTIHAGIFTSDLRSALTAASKIEAAGVMINDSSDFRFDGMPFGGFKYGSLGREGVAFALQEMTQTKVTCFRLPP